MQCMFIYVLCFTVILTHMHIQGVWDKFYILIFVFRLVGGINTHYALF